MTTVRGRGRFGARLTDPTTFSGPRTVAAARQTRHRQDTREASAGAQTPHGGNHPTGGRQLRRRGQRERDGLAPGVFDVDEDPVQHDGREDVVGEPDKVERPRRREEPGLARPAYQSRFPTRAAPKIANSMGVEAAAIKGPSLMRRTVALLPTSNLPGMLHLLGHSGDRHEERQEPWTSYSLNGVRGTFYEPRAEGLLG